MRIPRGAFLLASIAAGVPVLGAAGGRVRVVDAAREGHFAVVKALIAQKADVNVAEADGMTALHWAVRRTICRRCRC